MFTLLILICRNVKRAMTFIHFWEGLQCIFYDIIFNKDTEYWRWSKSNHTFLITMVTVPLWMSGGHIFQLFLSLINIVTLLFVFRARYRIAALLPWPYIELYLYTLSSAATTLAIHNSRWVQFAPLNYVTHEAKPINSQYSLAYPHLSFIRPQ